MRYVVAGYVFVLTVLFLYAVQLLWRRRRLARTVAQTVAAHPGAAQAEVGPVGAAPTAAPAREALG